MPRQLIADKHVDLALDDIDQGRRRWLGDA